jgi:hypothetical protein
LNKLPKRRSRDNKSQWTASVAASFASSHQGRDPLAEVEVAIFDWGKGQAEVRLKIPEGGILWSQLESSDETSMRATFMKLERAACRELRDLVRSVAAEWLDWRTRDLSC